MIDGEGCLHPVRVVLSIVGEGSLDPQFALNFEKHAHEENK